MAAPTLAVVTRQEHMPALRRHSVVADVDPDPAPLPGRLHTPAGLGSAGGGGLASRRVTGQEGRDRGVGEALQLGLRVEVVTAAEHDPVDRDPEQHADEVVGRQ